MLNPLILFAGQLLVTVVVLGFSTRRSAIRITIIPVLTICCALIVPRCMQFVHRSSWAALVGGYSTTFLLQYIATIISDRQDSLGEGSSHEMNGYRSAKEVRRNSNQARTSLWERVNSGLESACSCRWSGTPHEVRNVPLFSNQDPSYEPTRAVFLRHHIFLLVSCYLMLDVLSLGADPEKNKIFFAPAMIPFFTRLDQVSGEELAMRIFGTLGSGLGVFCSQQGVYSIVALIAVGLGRSEPRYWRPLFGSVSDAYTVRRFWRYVASSFKCPSHADRNTIFSRVWHQNNREKTSVPTRYIVRDVLNLPQKSYLGHQLCFFLVFLLSGFLHATIDLSAGIPWHESGAIRFFCTQALGIWIEEVARALCVGLYYGVQPLPRWTLLVGYIWVVLFLSWSWPAYMYPMLYRTREGSADSFLPFSVVGMLL